MIVIAASSTDVARRSMVNQNSSTIFV